jgi:hypothetical protein
VPNVHTLDPLLELLSFIHDPTEMNPLDVIWETSRRDCGGDLHKTAFVNKERLEELDARLTAPDAADLCGGSDRVDGLRREIAARLPRANESIRNEELIASRAAARYRRHTGGDGASLEDYVPFAAAPFTRPRARQRRDGPGRRRSSSSSSGDSSDSGDPEPPPPEGGRGRRLDGRRAIDRWLAERRRSLDALVRRWR